MEINDRPIEGNGGRVVWETGIKYRTIGQTHMVTVFDWDGRLVNRATHLDPQEARSRFDHPFAYPDTPDIFKREPASYADDDESESVPEEYERMESA